MARAIPSHPAKPGTPGRRRFLLPAAFFAAALALGAPPSPFLAAAKADAGQSPVVFVSWNLKNYLSMERRVGGELVPGAPKPEREILPLVAALIDARPDILGVSEIGDASHVADLQARLRAGGVDLPHQELLVSSDGQNRNLALLSRFPITARGSRSDLTYLIGKTRFPIQRGILDVTVAPAEDYRLRCVGLHFKSKREIPDADQAEMRRNEAHLTRQHLDSILGPDPDANLLVFGDLNDTPNESPARAVRGSFGSPGYLDDLRPRDPFGFRWTHYWAAADIYSRIDYMLVSQGFKPEVVRDSAAVLHPQDWETASDHRPLRMEFLPQDKRPRSTR